MPYKNGDEVLKDLRMQPQSPNYKTPAIAITAHITSGVERANHINAFDGYLVKPIDQVEFFLLVNKLLNDQDFSESPFIADIDTNSPHDMGDVFSYDKAKISMNADEQFISIMLNKFFSDLPDMLRDITFDMQQNEIQKVAETVHKVHGSAAYCGTPQLKAASKEFETTLRQKNTLLIPDAYQAFGIEADKLLTHKDEILHSLK